jgi:hypothetical protein
MHGARIDAQLQEAGPGASAVGIEQPVAHDLRDVVTVRRVEDGVEAVTADHEIRDLVGAEILGQVIDGETGAAVPMLCAEFMEQGLAS